MKEHSESGVEIFESLCPLTIPAAPTPPLALPVDSPTHDLKLMRTNEVVCTDVLSLANHFNNTLKMTSFIRWIFLENLLHFSEIHSKIVDESFNSNQVHTQNAETCSQEKAKVVRGQNSQI